MIPSLTYAVLLRGITSGKLVMYAICVAEIFEVGGETLASPIRAKALYFSSRHLYQIFEVDKVAEGLELSL